MKTISFLLKAAMMLAMAFTFSCTTTESGGEIGDGTSSGDGASSPSSSVPVRQFIIKNNTGYSIGYFYIKPSTSTDWGNYNHFSLDDGKSKTFTFSESLPSGTYDIKLTGSNNTFIKHGFAISNSITATFTENDSYNEGNYPSITIQNRTGVYFDAIYVKPIEASDWGKDYGGLSNNYDKSISIPIPPSNYTTFDIQMRSSNPTNTYTKRVTISNGDTLIYTSADSDKALTASPVIVIQNNTNYSIGYFYIKSPTSTDWGSYNHFSLDDGELRTFTLPQSLSDNSVYDIKLTGGNNTFIKHSFTVSEGMIVSFTGSDSYNESNYPSITIQNRTGVYFDAIYVKPIEASDWGKDYGGLSNNYDKSISIPIPPSNYTTFDIQMRSSNPTNTYTKRVTISNGDTLIYTSADSDKPLTASPVIVIQNNTGYSIGYFYIKSPTSTDWGSYNHFSLDDGELRTFTLPQSLSDNSVYDIKLTGGNNTFIKHSFTVSEGMIVTFTGSDLQQ